MNVLVAIYGDHPWNIPTAHVEYLRRRFPRVTFTHAADEAETMAHIRRAEVGFLGRPKAQGLARATRLRWVHSPAGGVGSLMFPEMIASPVIITNSRGLHGRVMAEHVIGVTIVLFRRLRTAVNKSLRPLPSGKIQIKNAYSLYFLLILVSIVLSFLVGEMALIIVLFSILLLFLYSKYLKRIPLVGNITVAFLTGLVLISGGVVVENPSAAIVPSVFAFLINLIREIVKDMEDVEGDAKARVITFPIKFGFQKSKYVILLISLMLILCTLYPYITHLYKIEYFVIVMVFANSILVYCLKILFEDHSVKNMKKISNLLKLSMVFGLIAIYFGV